MVWPGPEAALREAGAGGARPIATVLPRRRPWLGRRLLSSGSTGSTRWAPDSSMSRAGRTKSEKATAPLIMRPAMCSAPLLRCSSKLIFMVRPQPGRSSETPAAGERRAGTESGKTRNSAGVTATDRRAKATRSARGCRPARRLGARMSSSTPTLRGCRPAGRLGAWVSFSAAAATGCRSVRQLSSNPSGTHRAAPESPARRPPQTTSVSETADHARDQL